MFIKKALLVLYEKRCMMGELRKDYFLDRWVVISPKRGARPHELSAVKKEETACFFCPGNEAMTPPEIGRIASNGSWQVRWFENKFAALKPEGPAMPRTDNRFFTFSSAFGYHEVVVETPRHDRQLAQLSVDGIETVLNVYARRIAELERMQSVSYVNVFKNSGYLAGTSIVHSHSQVMATAVVPQNIREKIVGIRKFLRCPYCDIISAEQKGVRKCFENSDFIAFAPYASQFNYEVWIFPKMHLARFEQVNFSSLAKILSQVLRKVKELDYNLLVQYGPKGEDFHFHIEITPRPNIWGGFELGSGIIINTVAPEDAAKFYRGEEQ